MKLLMLMLNVALLTACSSLPSPTTAPDIAKLGEYYQQGEAAYQAGDMDKAVQHYQQALKEDPNHVPSYFRLGNIAARKGQLTEAKQYYQQVLKYIPEHPKAHYNLALIELMTVQTHLNHYQQWEKASKQSPNPQVTDLLLAIDAISSTPYPKPATPP